jgi:glyoxylase-like metal-dependent hydrolase (beta-lactamase superfamily II)/rhodanese-related sulfurtransferase
MKRDTISVKELRDWLDQSEPVTVLDVRPISERAEWSIPGSIHVDAYRALWKGDPDALADIDLPSNRPVVTVCAAGRTSQIAAEQLSKRGYSALSLDGGMKAWSEAWNIAEVTLQHGNDRGARVIQVRRTGKGCLSYTIGSRGEAAVIDASLDPQIYIKIAGSYGWKIKQALDTHIHADHLSRSKALADATGARLLLPEQRRVSYDFTPLTDGAVLNIGKESLRVLHTPGHTFESACYLLNDQALFTGDTLFLRSIGRPDLEATADEARTRASALYHSLRGLQDLPPGTVILPGHTSQPVPFDGRPICAPLSDVKQDIEVLNLAEDAFIEAVLSRIPPTPPNHHRIVELNEAGILPEGELTDLEAGANRCAIA